jgi:GDP-L-fucose synthase
MESSFLNVGTGVDLPIADLANQVAAAWGYGGTISWDTTKPDGTPRKLLDVSRLKAMGWSARITLAEGIRLAVANYNECLARSAA